MASKRLLYLSALSGAVVFYWAYREWLSWFLLLGLLLLPWFSLLVSLPAMVSCRGTVTCPRGVQLGQAQDALWKGQSVFPLPRLSGGLLVTNRLTGERFRVPMGEVLPTEHCGSLEIRLHHPRCMDYLGLFRLPVRRRVAGTMLVRPQPIPVDDPPDMTRYQVSAWRPKAGGGFSENHELRLYRPGDSLRQIHWKLSAKTGKLTVREPMEAMQNRFLLTAQLRGTPQQLDETLGKLQWMSLYLLQCELPHRICCLTGDGVETISVNCPEDTRAAIDRLLCCRRWEGLAHEDYENALWRYHIGGDGDGY